MTSKRDRAAYSSLEEIGGLVSSRKVSPVDLLESTLDRVKKIDPKLNAFITVASEQARQDALSAQREIQQKHYRGPLHGVPIHLKDNIETRGIRTTAGSSILSNFVPDQDAEVVRALRRAGAVIFGKTNLHEFAYGITSENPHYGAVHNPWNTEYMTGGSSGGSAAAIASGIGFGSLGTDTGGSVRIPSSLCGTVGLKPTFGRVSARGVIPLSPSLDHVGPIARTVADAAVVLQAIAGYDSRDPNSGNVPVPDYVTALEQTPARVRVGVPRKFFYENLDAETALVIEEALSVLEKQGADVRDIELKIPIDWSLLSAEAYACHAEFIRRSPELYQPETLRRFRAGESISAAEVDARRHELKNYRSEIDGVFKQIDVLVTPTTPHPAPRLAGLTEKPD